MSLLNQTYAQLRKDSCSVCYLVNEFDIHLPGTSTTFLSIFARFCLSSAVWGADKLLLYADNCVARNKNKLFISWLVIIVNDIGFIPKELCLTYLTPGHTMMSADATHGCIERKLSNSDYLTEDELISLIREARKDNFVTKLTYANFFEFFIPFDNFPFKVGEVKMLKVVKEDFCIYVKSDYNGQFVKHDILSESIREKISDYQKRKISIFQELKALDRPNGVPQRKIDSIKKAIEQTNPNSDAKSAFDKYLQ